MTYSIQREVSDGSLTRIDISIEFFDRTEIAVLVGGVVSTAWTWVTGANSILLNSAPAAGVEVMVVRTTSRAALRHVYEAGAAFTYATLDESLRQILHIAQEALEQGLSGDYFKDIDMHGYRVRNLGPGLQDSDAVTVAQVRSISDAVNVARTYGTYAQALAAAPGLFDGQIVLVDDTQRRYVASGGALVLRGPVGGTREVTTVTALTREVVATDVANYLRYTGAGVKSLRFTPGNFNVGDEFEVTNRSQYGVLSLVGNGVQMNAQRGGTLRLGVGDTVKLKAVASAVVDVLYGTTSTENPPVAADENATYLDEGTSTAGWTPTGGTLATSSSVLRITKSGAPGTSCNMVHPVSWPVSGRDFIVYGKVRATTAAGDGCLIGANDGVNEFGLWLGYNGSITRPGEVHLGFGPMAGQAYTLVAASVDYTSTFVDFALQYDSKFQQMSCWLRQTDGRWKLGARLAGTFNAATQLLVAKNSTSPTGAWAEFDHLIVSKPNFVAIGDSHCAGSTGFNPNMALGRSDYLSTWMYYANLSPTLRNNLIVNKGVGGQTSAEILARIAEATREGPRVVLLHASSNDTPATVPVATRTSNIRATLAAIVTAGQVPVLLNSLYAVATNVDNPGYRDYMLSWWQTYAGTFPGVTTYVDIATPVLDSAGFVSAALAQPDGVHLKPAGYDIIAQRIQADVRGL